MSDYSVKERVICEEFTKVVTQMGWTVYPECGGWDMLMVWEKDDFKIPRTKFVIKNGHQIGIQAKARPNFIVIKQTIEHRQKPQRPQQTAVLIPKIIEGYREVCNECGIIVFTPELKPVVIQSSIATARYEERSKDELVWTPSFVPDLPAGVNSPRQLTAWKQGALEICWLLRNRGYVSSHDFSRLDVDITLWRRKKWIKRDGDCGINIDGFMMKLARYTLGSNIGPDSEFPDIGWEDIQEELAKTHDLHKLVKK